MEQFLKASLTREMNLSFCLLDCDFSSLASEDQNGIYR